MQGFSCFCLRRLWPTYIDTEMEDVLERIRGKAKLGDSQKEELKDTLIPENCPFIKTPLLNPAIYNKVNDSATSRNKTAQRKQRPLVKSTMPLVKAVVALKALEHDAQIKYQMSPHFCIKVYD